MEKIVNLKDRIENKRQREQIERYRGKIKSIQKVIQCASCHFRCAMCGLHSRPQERPESSDSESLEFTLCESCRREYDEFISITRGEKKAEVFWHNREWLKMWSAWLSYRKSVDHFMDSSELKLLLEELNSPS